MSNDIQKPKYWRSFDELSQTEDWKTLASQEFEHGTSVEPLVTGQSRRHFLGVMGASMAMTGLSGCIRRPEETIMPYTTLPEHVLPGVPSQYATSTSIGGDVIGLLVESHEGRPTKIEGNPKHPSSRGALTSNGLGGTSASHQGMILELFDPQRLRYPLKSASKVPVTWDAVEKQIEGIRAQALAGKGKGVLFIAPSQPSPTIARLRGDLVGVNGRRVGAMPNARWFTFEAVNNANEREGLAYAFGKPFRAEPLFNRAQLILSIGSDFLDTEQGAVAAAADWARNRAIGEMDLAKDNDGNTDAEARSSRRR